MSYSKADSMAAVMRNMLWSGEELVCQEAVEVWRAARGPGLCRELRYLAARQ